MQEFAESPAGQQALLRHTALCFVVAGALGCLGGGVAGPMHLFDLSTITRYCMVSACVATSFAIFWCMPDGPRRWRPFTVSSKLAESIFGSAAGIIVFGGIAALIAEWL